MLKTSLGLQTAALIVQFKMFRGHPMVSEHQTLSFCFRSSLMTDYSKTQIS